MDRGTRAESIRSSSSPMQLSPARFFAHYSASTVPILLPSSNRASRVGEQTQRTPIRPSPATASATLCCPCCASTIPPSTRRWLTWPSWRVRMRRAGNPNSAASCHSYCCQAGQSVEGDVRSAPRPADPTPSPSRSTVYAHSIPLCAAASCALPHGRSVFASDFDETARLLALAGLLTNPNTGDSSISRSGSSLHLAGQLRAQRSPREIRLFRETPLKSPKSIDSL